MTQEEFAKHTAKQNDIKQFIQVLTPFVVNPAQFDESVKSAATKKLTALIDMIEPGTPNAVIKPLR